MVEPGSILTPTTNATPIMAAGLSGLGGASAAEDACDQCLAGFEAHGVGGGWTGRVDVATVFFSAHHAQHAAAIGAVVRKRLSAGVVVGVMGQGVIAGRVEQERGPGLSVLAASLPGVTVTPFTSTDLPVLLAGESPAAERTADVLEGADGDLAHLAEAVGMRPGHRATFVFCDPFSTPAHRLLPALARARALCAPGGAGVSGAGESRQGPVIGGMACGSSRPRGNVLLFQDEVRDAGLVGFSLAGPIRVDAVVSQGCRGFGPTLVITKANGQLIQQLGGRPALDVLHECIEGMGPDDRQLLSRGLFVGRVVNEYKERFGRDDFVIRNVAGVLKDARSLAVADEARVGQTIRFHVRDARTASEDLAMLMDAQSLRDEPLGALLVTCNGRGTRLFPAPHHDAQAVARLFTAGESDPGEQKAKPGRAVNPASLVAASVEPPVAGYFAGGEIGPVGSEVFLHGQTASIAIFRKG
jgi:small ligand-binding sensory domain FIST